MTRVLNEISQFAGDLVAIRRDIHAHPELGFEETRTSALVADKLREWGIEVHRGIAGTGVVGVINGASPGPSIGLRADMDALPMEETSGKAYASKTPGLFHGCGHDGHTTMLLGAARYLAATRHFAGRAIVIFQPAEEGLGGARAMISDGLFDRFPCNEIYGLHNVPGLPKGYIASARGACMAAADTLEITISGKGGHGASPHKSIDPIMAATAVVQALQTIVSRNIDPALSAVLSITQIHAGTANNVIPDTARIGGTIRTFNTDLRAMILQRVQELTKSICSGFGVSVDISLKSDFRVLENSAIHVDAAFEIARGLVGDKLVGLADPSMQSEDFADMLAVVPGAFLFVGQGPGAFLHNPDYDFNDDTIPIGASLLASLVETRAA